MNGNLSLGELQFSSFYRVISPFVKGGQGALVTQKTQDPTAYRHRDRGLSAVPESSQISRYLRDLRIMVSFGPPDQLAAGKTPLVGDCGRGHD